MRYIVSLYFFLFSLNFSFSQSSGNLIENWSFENITECPWWYSQLSSAPPWFQPSNATPDLYHECALETTIPLNPFGYQYARNGNAYAGIIVNTLKGFTGVPSSTWSEYLAIPLNQSLMLDSTYYVSFWVSLADSASKSIDRLGLGVSIGYHSYLYNHTSNINVVPKVESPDSVFLENKTKWMEVKGSFVADTKGYDHIYIGNLHDTSETRFKPTGYNPYGGWYSNIVYYVDDVCVSSDSLYCYNYVVGMESENIDLKVFPNPFVETIRIESNSNINLIEVIDFTGRIVYKIDKPNKDQEHDLSLLPKGNYILSITTENDVSRRIIMKGE